MIQLTIKDNKQMSWIDSQPFFKNNFQSLGDAYLLVLLSLFCVNIFWLMWGPYCTLPVPVHIPVYFWCWQVRVQ